MDMSINESGPINRACSFDGSFVIYAPVDATTCVFYDASRRLASVLKVASVHGNYIHMQEFRFGCRI